MTGRCLDILRKVERAEKHIQDLNAALSAFFNTKPYSVRFEDKPDTAERIYYIDRIETVPVEISLIVGDALHNLRSTLDHLACSLVEVAGKAPTTKTEFPIGWDAVKFLSPSFLARKVQGMRKEAVDRICAVKPYKGGDDTLWWLHALDNKDKHHLILTALSALDARGIMPSERAELYQVYRGSHGINESLPDLNGALIPMPEPIPLKAGNKLLTVPHSELEQYVSFHFDVAFNEPKIIPIKPALGTLQQMAANVRAIVTSFDDLLS